MKQVNGLPNAYLYESIKNIDRLSNGVYKFLALEAHQHQISALPRRQEIVVVVEEPILASQLKYQQKELLNHLNTTLLSEFKTIKIKLTPPKMVTQKPTKRPKPLRKDISILLESVRDELDSD